MWQQCWHLSLTASSGTSVLVRISGYIIVGEELLEIGELSMCKKGPPPPSVCTYPVEFVSH